MADTQNMRRRLDGSIDIAHYDRIARDLRSHDQRAALDQVLNALEWLMKSFGLHLLMRIGRLGGRRGEGGSSAHHSLISRVSSKKAETDINA